MSEMRENDEFGEDEKGKYVVDCWHGNHRIFPEQVIIALIILHTFIIVARNYTLEDCLYII